MSHSKSPAGIVFQTWKSIYTSEGSRARRSLGVLFLLSREKKMKKMSHTSIFICPTGCGKTVLGIVE